MFLKIFLAWNSETRPLKHRQNVWRSSYRTKRWRIYKRFTKFFFLPVGAAWQASSNFRGQVFPETRKRSSDADVASLYWQKPVETRDPEGDHRCCRLKSLQSEICQSIPSHHRVCKRNATRLKFSLQVFFLHAAHPSRGPPNTSRRIPPCLSVGARDICGISETSTCSVAASEGWGGHNRRGLRLCIKCVHPPPRPQPRSSRMHGPLWFIKIALALSAVRLHPLSCSSPGTRVSWQHQWNRLEEIECYF